MEASDTVGTAANNILNLIGGWIHFKKLPPQDDVPELRLTIFEYVVYYGISPINIIGCIVVLTLQFIKRKDTM